MFKNQTFPPYFKRPAVAVVCLCIVFWATISLHPRGFIYNVKPIVLFDDAPQYAFATILTAEGDAEYPDVEEPYLKAARLLTYQLLHNPRTRNGSVEIPLLVLVTPDVPQNHRDILEDDGATIVPVESLGRDWIHPKWGRWSNVLAKLNLWNLEKYDKIAFLDADSVIFRPIEGIFESPQTDVRQTLTSKVNTTSELPEHYMIAGIHDPWMELNMPPVKGQEFYEKNNYMNAGFFVLSPSKPLFDYYVSILDTPDQFDSAYPEQNLLNCAHRTDGSMPWQDLGPGWNLKGGSRFDYEAGLMSIHHKWWRPIGDEFMAERIAEAMEEMRIHLRILEEQGEVQF
ncbi:nucleotide-diphospho-sugar transferase [Penicillium cataractarum]|uniref:Nucleotide-diphospho-sugar transferase n=1 Tax=Penicillium cataractarum TaxID=2100454 RepID=A0A9W9RYW4_9EURO|nr:nucleotide-diphospho-sugar transferase [Penicillium cataractarum]KAJ5368917.1 nucleotide-diphospho-sugar transferase [Penicillium cataractarum]